MDCFYAAVEVKHRPELRGKALGIGGPPNSRAVLCTASYEARRFGVRSAMPSSQAVRLCPDLILLRPNFELYKQESRQVRAILQRYSDRIEPLSLDEAYLDVTHTGSSATLIARDIRQAIAKELALPASAGIAPNKFLAKIASDWNKPNGQFTIRPQDIDAFMLDLKIEKIWGVGKVTAKKMHGLGLKTCGDIQKQPLLQLSRWFGNRAGDLADLARGIDQREVRAHSKRKSLTVEETFNQDRKTYAELLKELPSLYRDWDVRMQKVREPIRGHVVKLRFHDFRITTRERASRQWPQEKDFIELLQKAWSLREEPVRLLGIGVRLGEEESDSDQLSFSL